MSKYAISKPCLSVYTKIVPTKQPPVRNFALNTFLLIKDVVTPGIVDNVSLLKWKCVIPQAKNGNCINNNNDKYSSKTLDYNCCDSGDGLKVNHNGERYDKARFNYGIKIYAGNPYKTQKDNSSNINHLEDMNVRNAKTLKSSLT